MEKKLLVQNKSLWSFLLVMFSVFGWAQTATYTVATTTSVTTSGTAPSGSSATFANTYTTNKNQLTSGNSATLTLSGYAGYKITSIVLNMASNASAGAGNLSVVAGSTTIASVATNNFNNALWNGAYSSTPVNITKTPTAYNIASGESVVIKIAATTNSLYIYSYSITYAPSNPTFNSTATGGDWNVASTWVENAVPSAGSTVNIVGPVNINNTSGQFNNTGTININNSGVLKCAFNPGASLTGTGTVNVTGTGILSVEQGGWPGTTNTYNYGTTGTLQFNNTSGSYVVNSTDTWFPATIPNVNVLGAGGITVNSAHTISTLLQASAPITTASNLTVDGTFQINSTAATLSNAINYGTASTLLYNVNATMARGNEWNNNPANVTLQNNTVLNYPSNWGTFTRTITGNLTINSGSALYMDYGSPTNGVGLLTVGGNVVLAGNLSLGNKPGGDLAVGGNWTNTGAANNFNPNGRAVIFNGTAAQNITNALGETFNYLIINKTAGSVKLANNVTVNGTTGSVLQLINAGTLDLNGKSLTLSNNGGNILVDGAARTLTSTVLGATLNITGTKTVAATNGGSLIIAPNITTILTSGLDFGADLTTVQGTLQIKAGGYVNTNAPKYASTSTLEYNGVTGYGVGNEWTAASGTVGTTAGFPQNILLTSSSINMPNSNRGLAGNITIGTGSTLNLNGTSGDLYVGGHWVNSGTFNPNNRAVFFNGAAAQNLTGATTFDWLIMNNTTGGLNLQASSPVTINNGLTLTSGAIYIGANNLTIPASATITGGSATSHVATLNGGTGKLVRTGVGNTDVLFPLGISGTKYSPITVKNTTGTSDLSINLNNSTFTGAVFDATQVVKMQWNITSTAATTAVITPVWETADQGSAMVNPGTGELGNYINPNYVIYSPVSLTQFTTSASNVALQSGANYIVVGNTGGIYTAPPANDDCSGAIALTVDAAAVNGTVKAATTSAATSCGATGARKDVWYKFTTTDAGNYAITVVGSATFDAVIDVRSGDCTTNTNVACKDGAIAGGTELLNTYAFAANTTYFVRVFHYFTADPADKTFTIAIASPPAVITATPATLTFVDTNVNANSADQIVSVGGVFLTPASGDITVSSPSTDFEVSKDGTTWGSSATYAYTGKKLAASDVHIRFTPKTGCAKTANIAVSGGGATTVNIAVSGNGVIPAPAATDATIISDVGFTANWNAVSGATGYALDVSTSPTFTAPDNTAVLSEGFETGLTASYQTGNVTLSSGVWSVTNVMSGTTGVNSGSKSAQLQSATGSNIISPSLNNVSGMSFYVTSSTATGALQVNYSTDGGTTWTAAPGSPFTGLGTTKVQKTITLTTATTGATLVEFKRTAATIYLDDININYTGEKPSFVTGYNNLPVTGTSQVVTGLDPNATYYYRVRATTGASCSSVNSNVITVTTRPGTVTWSGTAWSNTTGPTKNYKATIAGNYDSTNNTGSFNSYDLTVNPNVDMYVLNGMTVKVENGITNNGNFVVESGGNLIQTNESNSINTGNINVRREIKIKDNAQYNYVSSPVVGGNLKNNIYRKVDGTFVSSPFALYYVESNNKFGNSSGVNIQGRALAIKEPAAPITGTINMQFTGVPFNGGLTYNLLNSNTATVTDLGYNLIGNPYPSNIDLQKFYNLKTNKTKINPTFWFWDSSVNTVTSQAGSGYLGQAYATVNVASGPLGTGVAPTAATGSAKTPNQFASVAQGFIVRALANNVVVDFDNTIRTSSSPEAYFGAKGNTSDTDRYWLNISSPSNLTNQMAVVYFENGNNAFSEDDSELSANVSDEVFSILDNKKVIINGRSSFVSSDIIPLGTTHFSDGNYTISLGNKEGVFANGQNIYLKDKQARIITNLNEGSYTFSANAGESTGRFEIVYEPQNILATGNQTKEELVVYRDGSDFVVKAQTNKITALEMYDAAGRLMYSSKPADTKVILDSSTISSGVYILKINQNGKMTTRKIIK